MHAVQVAAQKACQTHKSIATVIQNTAKALSAEGSDEKTDPDRSSVMADGLTQLGLEVV